jgi:hypothetical protein
MHVHNTPVRLVIPVRWLWGKARWRHILQRAVACKDLGVVVPLGAVSLVTERKTIKT